MNSRKFQPVPGCIQAAFYVLADQPIWNDSAVWAKRLWVDWICGRNDRIPFVLDKTGATGRRRPKMGLEFRDKLAKQLIDGYVGRADVRRRESQKRVLTVDISPENSAHHFSKIVGRKRECVHLISTPPLWMRFSEGCLREHGNFRGVFSFKTWKFMCIKPQIFPKCVCG